MIAALRQFGPVLGTVPVSKRKFLTSPSIVFRRNTARDYADMVIDHFTEMLRSSDKYPAVCSISLHHFIVGQPHRLHHLRRAFAHIAEHRDEIWITTPAKIAQYYKNLPEDQQIKAD